MSAGAAVYLGGNVFYLARLGVHGRRWLAVRDERTVTFENRSAEPV